MPDPTNNTHPLPAAPWTTSRIGQESAHCRLLTAADGSDIGSLVMAPHLTEAQTNHVAGLLAAAPALLGALVKAHQSIKDDRAALYSCCEAPDGTLEDSDQQLIDEMDALLREIDAAINAGKGGAA